jgi:type I restriction enzyme S subunit
LAAKAKGATFKQINREDIGELRIALPPLSEQRRIAEILDKADALRAKRRTALTQLDALAQSIFIDMFGDPAHNTKRLPLVALGELGEWQSGGTPPRTREDYFRGAIPWFSSGELEPMYVAESNEYLTSDALEETSAKRVPKGALMLGMYDTAALKASIAAVDASCNQAIAFSVLCNQLSNVAYVYFAIVVGRERFRRLQRGVRQKNLNLSMIRAIQIPLPPLPLQHQFARCVAEVECLRKRHKAAQSQAGALFASLQHRAFRGEL